MMEKFAVDLEKVLDEFEFNEEREERVPPSVINNQSLSYICHVPPPRSLPVNYRRPSFEPINLADADFAASPPRSSRAANAFNGQQPNGNTSAVAVAHQQSSSKGGADSSSSYVNPMIDRHLEQVLSGAEYASERALLTETFGISLPAEDQDLDRDRDRASWSSEEETSSLSEEKPDLIDSSTLKLQPSVSSTRQTNRGNGCLVLPDVTSSNVTASGTFSSSPPSSRDDDGLRLGHSGVFDLINTSSGAPAHSDDGSSSSSSSSSLNVLSNNNSDSGSNNNSKDIVKPLLESSVPDYLDNLDNSALDIVQCLSKDSVSKEEEEEEEVLAEGQVGGNNNNKLDEEVRKVPTKGAEEKEEPRAKGEGSKLQIPKSYIEASLVLVQAIEGLTPKELDDLKLRFVEEGVLDEADSLKIHKICFGDGEEVIADTGKEKTKEDKEESGERQRTPVENSDAIEVSGPRNRYAQAVSDVTKEIVAGKAVEEEITFLDEKDREANVITKEKEESGFSEQANCSFVTNLTGIGTVSSDSKRNDDQEVVLKSSETPSSSIARGDIGSSKSIEEASLKIPIAPVGFEDIEEPCDEELEEYLEELEKIEEEKEKAEESEARNRFDERQSLTAKYTSPIGLSAPAEDGTNDSIATDNQRLKSLREFIENNVSDSVVENTLHDLQAAVSQPNALEVSRPVLDERSRGYEIVLEDAEDGLKEDSTLDRNFEIRTNVISDALKEDVPIIGQTCDRRFPTLETHSELNATSPDNVSGIKPLECQAAVAVRNESHNPAHSSGGVHEVKSESYNSVDPETVGGVTKSSRDIETTDNSSSSSKVEAMGNSADKSIAAAANVETVNASSSSSPAAAEEAPCQEEVKPPPASAAEEDKPPRPNFLELPARFTVDNDSTTSATPSIDDSEVEYVHDDVAAAAAAGASSSHSSTNSSSGEHEHEQQQDGEGDNSSATTTPDDQQLGKVPPFWVPDTDAAACMQCEDKFTLIKRRHHCRACGRVLCSKCCCMKAKLVFIERREARVCQRCYNVIDKEMVLSDGGVGSGAGKSSPLGRQPNPNNPMEYCSTIPPLQQVAGSLPQPPPSVLVPVGVLKREGRVKSSDSVAKQVMFSDGIRPGGDLTELDGSGEPRMPFRRPGRLTKRVGTPPGGPSSSVGSRMRRAMDPVTHSFIPNEGEKNLPPTVVKNQGETVYSDFENGAISLNQPPLKFAINRNLFVHIKRVVLDCCVNRECWCVTSEGLACVGQDEVILVLECLPDEPIPPKDVFLLVNTLFLDASKGNTVSELSFSPSFSNNLLGSRDHGGFLYIRPSYQCTAQLILPNPPYLVALLVHRWETPWARLFPIRLELRLGAEFRYYPCPLVSVRHRQPLYTDIGHTIINILADFRKYSYTLPVVRGLVVHMEDRQTTILLPRNRYDQVVRALNNSNDSVLAFGANLSLAADSHLVCMQSTEDENSYHTQAINIHNKPRKVTGASFVVFNGALKACGLSGKSSIVEDGLMVQVPSETMAALRQALRDMRDYTIGCGPHSEETVLLKWTADDTNFNIGVKSCVDGRPLDGVPSMRVHSGTDFSGHLRVIRWTEVFILQCEEGSGKGANDPLDISRLSESLARATCMALVPYLDLLATANLSTVAVRATIHPDNVGYEAGSEGEKLPPLYMKSLDDELVAVVHQAAIAAQDTPATLELVFRIMET